MKSIIFKIFSFIPNKIVFFIVKLLAYSKAYKVNPKDALLLLFSIEKEIETLEGYASIRYEKGLHAKHRLTNYHQFFIDNIPAGSTVLDIGCGLGALAFDIANNVVDVKITGIDLNNNSLESAKKNFQLPNTKFIYGDATKDLPDEKFDVIVLSNVLEHIELRSKLLMKVADIYQPKFFLIRVPMYNRDWRVPLMDELGFDYRMDNTHFIEYTVDVFEREIEESGLRIVFHKVNWGEIWAVIEKNIEI